MPKQWIKINEIPYDTEYRKMSKIKFKLPNGKTHNFDIIKGKNIACVLALNKKRQVILAKQFRPGPEKFLWELPAGVIEESEKPREAASRELLEETGYKGELKYVGKNLNSAYSTQIRYAFVALNCEKIADPSPDETEFIEPVLVSIKQFRKLLQAGRLSDPASGYMALDYLGLL